MPVFLIFIAVPILEMWLLIQVGSRIGALPTVGLVLLTAVVGLWLLRKQGLQTLVRANQKMERGELPAKEMVEGICLAVGGALLLTPGFFTDALGFACLIPGLRHWLLGYALKGVIARASASGAHFYRYQRRDDGSEEIIEGEFTRQAPRDDQNRLR